MLETDIETAIHNATQVIDVETSDPARFLLYPDSQEKLDQLTIAVRSALVRMKADVETRPVADPPTLVITLPGRMMINGQAPYDTAYLMAQRWHLRAAEPEVYTDLFSEDDTDVSADPNLADEGLFDPCFVPKDPELDKNRRWALDMMRVPLAWAYSKEEGRPRACLTDLRVAIK
jgi:hypothetical protein